MAVKNTEELTVIYRRSLENMRQWLGDSPLRFDMKLGIIDAWQEELRLFFKENGHCRFDSRYLLRTANVGNSRFAN